MIPAIGSSVKELISHYLQTQIEFSSQNSNIPTKGSNEILRVVSYNVHWWNDSNLNENFESTLSCISALEADIIVIEESNYIPNPNIDISFKLKVSQDRQRRLNEIGFIYSSFTYFNKNEEVEMMPMIISKYPFRYVKHHFLDDYRILIEALVELPFEKEICIFGTHLDVYDESEETRCHEIRTAVNKMKLFSNLNQIPHLLAGDFNALRKNDYSPSSDTWNHFIKHDSLRDVETKSNTIDILEGSGYTDCFVKANLPVPQSTVWSCRRIDYIYLENDFPYPILGCYVYHNTASDHIPVICDFNIV